MNPIEPHSNKITLQSSTPQTIKLAVYGTLRKGYGNYYHFLQESSFLGIYTTQNKYRLIISDYSLRPSLQRWRIPHRGRCIRNKSANPYWDRSIWKPSDWLRTPSDFTSYRYYCLDIYQRYHRQRHPSQRVFRKRKGLV